MKYHEPVLLNEVLEFLNVHEGGRYIDATLGDGGHTVEILKRGGKVLGIDYSKSSLERASERIKSEGLSGNFTGVVENFKNIDAVAKQYGFDAVDGILFDLGYSTSQLEEDSLGISFTRDEPLDMRIDKSLGVSAEDMLSLLSEKQMEQLFREYGEERMAKRFAKAIAEYRSSKKIRTTKELADVIVSEAPSGYEHGRIHPATRVFQALRIVVNDEIENLKIALPRAARLLKLPGGRMLIISFHSLEDKVAKDLSHNVRPELNLMPLVKGPIAPDEEEVERNRRSRSAKLRVYEIV